MSSHALKSTRGHARHVVTDTETLELPFLVKLVDRSQSVLERSGPVRSVEIKDL